jgi:hypothetical protein
MAKSALYKKQSTELVATELKQLDVDRIDGVDRPATGRSFAVAKSRDVKKAARLSYANIVYNPRNPASVVKAMITEKKAQVRRGIYGAVLHKAIENMVFEVRNDAGQPVGYLVKDEGWQSQVFKTAEEACSAVKGMLDRALSDEEEREGELDENGEMDPASTHLSPATSTPLDSEANADPSLGQRKPTQRRKWNRL